MLVLLGPVSPASRLWPRMLFLRQLFDQHQTMAYSHACHLLTCIDSSSSANP
ncbi:hypothetical protein BT67DRAFT_443974, partial [Trichocladium antarcticum]